MTKYKTRIAVRKCRDVNKATRYKTKALSGKAKAKNFGLKAKAKAEA